MWKHIAVGAATILALISLIGCATIPPIETNISTVLERATKPAARQPFVSATNRPTEKMPYSTRVVTTPTSPKPTSTPTNTPEPTATTDLLGYFKYSEFTGRAIIYQGDKFETKFAETPVIICDTTNPDLCAQTLQTQMAEVNKIIHQTLLDTPEARQKAWERTDPIIRYLKPPTGKTAGISQYNVNYVFEDRLGIFPSERTKPIAMINVDYKGRMTTMFGYWVQIMDEKGDIDNGLIWAMFDYTNNYEEVINYWLSGWYTGQLTPSTLDYTSNPNNSKVTSDALFPFLYKTRIYDNIQDTIGIFLAGSATRLETIPLLFH